MSPRYDLVLFDLDGTIIDSEPGVQAALRHALVAGFGISPTQAELEEFMGPPLSDILPRLYGMTDPADHERFFELYCDVYFHGMEYDFDLYPGIADLIRDLAAAGVRLVLATAKPHESASRILERAGLAEYFTYVAGSLSDGSRQEKADVLEHAFEVVEETSPGPHAVMVGDRAVDARAAHAHGLDSVVVEWGYAAPGELDGCGATHRAETIADLCALLLAA